jgi:ankyrin repeat protein
VTPEWKAAVLKGDVATLAALAAAGLDIDSRDEHGQTGLMIAAREGQVPVVEWLVARGAALDCAAKYNLTALMLAVVNSRVAVVRALVDAGADLTIRGTGPPGFHGRTARDLAAQRADYAFSDQLGEIVRILDAKSA